MKFKKDGMIMANYIINRIIKMENNMELEDNGGMNKISKIFIVIVIIFLVLYFFGINTLSPRF